MKSLKPGEARRNDVMLATPKSAMLRVTVMEAFRESHINGERERVSVEKKHVFDQYTRQGI
jgi:hypothetical protein